jgi:hypothetical protein
MRVGFIQSIEGLKRRKDEVRENSTLSGCLRAWTWSYPDFELCLRLELTLLALLVSGLLTDWNYTISLLSL